MTLPAIPEKPWFYITEFEMMTTTNKNNLIERVIVFHWYDTAEKKDAYIGFVWRPANPPETRFDIMACNANDSKRYTEPEPLDKWVARIISYTFNEIDLNTFPISQQVYRSVAEDFNKWLALLPSILPRHTQLLPTTP